MDKQTFRTRMKNILLPCVFMSFITGSIVGALVFLFKYTAQFLYDTTGDIYAFVSANPGYIPLIFLGLAALATLSWLILKWCPAAKGGGIPSAVGIARGILSLQWLRTLVATFVSACISFFAGLPLGTEGPSVQMGTAMGRGMTKASGKKNQAWDRYLMTGGASAGFAAATAAPISGIFFALEEIHKKFSPMILLVNFVSCISAAFMSRMLSQFAGISPYFIDMEEPFALNVGDLWIPIVVGIAAGLAAVLFSEIYKLIVKFWGEKLGFIPMYVKLLIVFFICGICGLFLNPFLGSGHAVIEMSFEAELSIGILAALFITKSVMILLSSNTGATGGMFIPMLTVGAIVGAILGKIFVACGLSPEYQLPIIAIAMAAFLGAAMHTPITALVFSIEALSCLNNVLFVGVAVFFAYLLMEILGVESVTGMVLKSRIEDRNKNKVNFASSAHLSVKPNSFAVGKALSDLFLPYRCIVLSVTQDDVKEFAGDSGRVFKAGDKLHIRFLCADEDYEEYLAKLCDIFGKQQIGVTKKEHYIPEM